jgi:hypothetical protein
MHPFAAAETLLPVCSAVLARSDRHIADHDRRKSDRRAA